MAMTANLPDLTARRQADLCRYLAGAVLIDPLVVLPMLSKLNNSTSQTSRPRIFLLQARELLPELKNGSDNDAVAELLSLA